MGCSVRHPPGSQIPVDLGSPRGRKLGFLENLHIQGPVTRLSPETQSVHHGLPVHSRQVRPYPYERHCVDHQAWVRDRRCRKPPHPPHGLLARSRQHRRWRVYNDRYESEGWLASVEDGSQGNGGELCAAHYALQG